MKRALFVLAIALLVGADEKPDAVKADREKLQGVWAVTSAHLCSGSTPTPPLDAKEVASMRRVFTGNKYVVMDGDDILVEASFTLDPSKTPKAITVKRAASDKPVEGIYEI